MIEEIDNQVATLKELTRRAAQTPRTVSRRARRVPYTMAVTSGKGGVGKTLVTVHLALHFARMGMKVLIIDADLGLANVDVMLGMRPRHTIQDVLDGRLSLDEVAIEGPEGIVVLPAASGVADLSHLSDQQRIALLDHIDNWNAEFDVVLVDTGAGISPNVRYFVLAVERILVVATPDPTSIADAYALIKVMYLNHRVDHFELIVNQVDPEHAEQDGKEVYRIIQQAADRFLNIGLDYIAAIPHDDHLARVVREGRVLDPGEHAPYLRVFADMAETVLRLWQLPGGPAGPQSTEPSSSGRPMFFWRRLLDDPVTGPDQSSGSA
jgi:flagellar biosynthesis protein FlhG